MRVFDIVVFFVLIGLLMAFVFHSHAFDCECNFNPDDPNGTIAHQWNAIGRQDARIREIEEKAEYIENKILGRLK